MSETRALKIELINRTHLNNIVQAESAVPRHSDIKKLHPGESDIYTGFIESTFIIRYRHASQIRLQNCRFLGLILNILSKYPPRTGQEPFRL